MPALRARYESEVDALMKSLPEAHKAEDADFEIWGRKFVAAMVRGSRRDIAMDPY
jgi:hypothetical protein